MSRKSQSQKQKRKRRHIHRPAAHHMPPGSIIVDPDAPKPVLNIIAFSPDAYEEADITDVGAIAGYRAQWPVVWVNVTGLGDAQVIRQLGDEFGLHRLALEDVVNLYQRAKVENFGDRLFIVTRMIAQRSPLETEQLSLFLGPGFVLTIQQRPGDPLDPIRQRIRKRQGRVRDNQADYLAYALLDAVMDDYFPVLEEHGERIETMEEKLLDRPRPELLTEIRQAKRDLMTLRRALWPQREALNSLARDPHEIIAPETRIFFRDCYDHALRLMEMTEHYREHCSDLMDVYLTSLSHRMNEIMKTLTVIASIFIPLTFIVGIYGMNFDIEASPWNMPELYTYWGYPAVMLMMLFLSLAMLWYFRRKGWIGKSAQ